MQSSLAETNQNGSLGEINPIILLGKNFSEIPYGDKKLLEYAIAVRSTEIETQSLSSQGHTDIVLMMKKLLLWKEIHGYGENT